VYTDPIRVRRLENTMPSNSISLAHAALLGALLAGCSETGVTKTGDVSDDPPTEPAPFSTDWGQWLSMTTHDGKPAIAFYDRAQGGLGFALGTMRDGIVEWSFEGVDGYPDSSGLDLGDRGTYGSLAVDASGMFWASFHDVGAKNLRYAKRHPGLKAWKTGIADVGEGTSPDAGRFSSIAIGADGNPLIAHHDQGSGTLRIARWNGSGFTGGVFDRGDAFEPDTGTDEESREANVGQFVKLKVIDGVEYMAYYDSANGDLKMSVGSDIHVVDAEGDVGKWPDFEIMDGIIHIVYQDAGNQHLKHAAGTPGSWTVSVVDSAPYTGADTAIYFRSGNPEVVYFEGRSNDMKRAQLEGGSWKTEVIASEGAVGFHNEVIQVDGQPYVGCYDYTARNVRFEPLD
jgi:hypothetical protein